MQSIKISPSILSANFACLEDDIKKVVEAGAELIHVDVMDGHFVPNITIGPCVVNSIKKICPVPLDVHLMITDPQKYLESFVKAGSDWITFHIETVKNATEFIDYAKTFNIKVGVSIKPATPPKAIFEILPHLDLILIMSVDPGFGGQKFMHEALEKVKELRKHPDCPDNISIDGGINLHTGKLAVQAGANILVAGSSIFKSENPVDMIRSLKVLP